MKTAFITGASGFVGRHLMAYLDKLNWRVAGSDLSPQGAPAISTFYQADVNDRATLRRAFHETHPDVIFHLAGVIKSNTPDKYYQAHVLGTVAMLDAVVESGSRPVVFIASSSAVYGSGLGGRPITEQFKPRPATHYGVSKLAQELAALHYFTSFGLPVLLVRTFNLLGPGLSPQLACSDFARQIALAETNGKPSTIMTGNISARRDFVDVRDAVRAYAGLVENGLAGQAYNVASGQAVTIRECLDFLRKQARVRVEAKVDPDRVQADDIPVQAGSIKRTQAVTGWELEYSTEQSLLDMLEDWRRRVTRE
jgi:GDP-4-dehydro-6-deoxy-D-mannose reductase